MSIRHLEVAVTRRAAPQGFRPVLATGTDAAVYCFLFLYLSAAGPGRWSLEARRNGTR